MIPAPSTADQPTRLPALISQISAVTLLILGTTSLIGAGPITGFAPAASYFLCGVALWFLSAAPTRASRITAIGASTLLVLLSIAFWYPSLSPIDVVAFNESTSGIYALYVDGRLTRSLTIAFGLLGLTFFLHVLEFKRWPGLRQLPLVVVFWIGYLSLISLLYNVTESHHLFERVLIPLPAAFLLLVASIGILTLSPRTGFVGILTSPAMGGALSRILLPIIVALPFTLGWARLQALRTGSYPLEAGFATFTTSNVTVFVLFLIFSAHTLNRLDEKRRRAYASLKSANLELHKVNQTLKSKIKEQVQTEAARQKTELELFQSQKMEAMGTLASGIAHDFNNMLTVIQLNAENALDIARKQTPESEEMLRSLKDIKQAGVRAADVVRKIMTFGRKTPGLKKPVHVEDAIKETLEMLRHSRPKDVILHTDIPSDLPAVFADPTQIQQVLINLGTNAVQAMSEHGGDLTIRVAPVTVTADQAIAWGGPNGNTMSTGPYVRISVIDTGHGMDGETLKKIFDPFFTTKPPGKGTGLGLSVAHGIMRIHGGAITVESAPGVGTCFHVFFPVLPKNTTTLEAPTDSGSEDPGH